MKGKISEDKVVNVAVYILLAFVGIVTLYPFYYTIICSFNDGLDLMKGGVYLCPRKFTLSNYELFIGDEAGGMLFCLRSKDYSRNCIMHGFYQHVQLCAVEK